MVFVLSGLVNRLSAGVMTTLFMLYSVLTGLTLSSIFIIYTASSIASTFVVTGGMFGVMSLWGYTTKRDLSGWGNMLFMALIGIITASLVNFWLKSEALMWAVTYIGVVVFVGLTAYDTQKLKISVSRSMSATVPTCGNIRFSARLRCIWTLSTCS